MVHVNPLKKRVVMVPNEGTGKTFEVEEHMSWEDAAKVALIITLAQIFTGFLTMYDWSKISIDPNAFLFDLIKFSGATFFGTFVVLTGLSRYFSK